MCTDLYEPRDLVCWAHMSALGFLGMHQKSWKEHQFITRNKYILIHVAQPAWTFSTRPIPELTIMLIFDNPTLTLRQFILILKILNSPLFTVIVPPRPVTAMRCPSDPVQQLSFSKNSFSVLPDHRQSRRPLLLETWTSNPVVVTIKPLLRYTASKTLSGWFISHFRSPDDAENTFIIMNMKEGKL